jgi:hypothetical protein
MSLSVLGQYCDMTPESRNSPLLNNGSLKRVSAATDTHWHTLVWRSGFMKTDLVRNAFSVLTESKFSTDTNKQPTFSMKTGGHINGRVDRNEDNRC